MKHVLIVNPVSGMCDISKKIIPEFENAVSGLDFAVEITKARGHAAEIAQQYSQCGEPVRFYSCGGDGTLNETIRGCYKYKNAEVASLPYGSGNDFIRNFGEREEFLNLSDTIEGKAVEIDLMMANDGVCAAIASVGIDAEVAYGIPAFRRLPFCGGQTAYNLSIIKRICKKIGRNMKIEIDGEVFCGDYLLAAVCNGSSYGGGYNAAPNADLTDGLLDVILVKKTGRLRIAKILSEYKKGLHLKDGEVVSSFRDIMSYRLAKQVNIYPADKKPVVINIDGECEEAKGLSLSVLPLAARFVLPLSVYGRFKQKVVSV